MTTLKDNHDGNAGKRAKDALLTATEAASYLRLPAGQLKQWRHLRKGPPYLKLGRTVRYWHSDLDAWLAAQRVTHEEAA